MSHKEIVEKTVAYVQETLADAEGGHDWWHIERVWKLSKHIAKQEKVNLLVVELGALLHDIADSKFHDGDETIGPRKTRQFLDSIKVDSSTIAQVVKIVEHVSFRSGTVKNKYESPELNVVQDADRLDAIGAVGIARTFNYGGHKNREIYNPNISPNLKMTKEEYKNSTAPTINHFYEKLLLLKSMMNTKTGSKIANERHKFMEKYLEQFYKEWNGEK
ncbi:MAG: HD domain-containing protein [Patescibacteria group bacterium]